MPAPKFFMNAIDLLSLAQLKAWLSMAPTVTSDDGKLAGIITAVSSDVLRITGRSSFAVQSYSEVRDGTGTPTMTFKNFPAISVSSLVIDTTTIQASPDGVQPGYVFDQYKLEIVGLPPYFSRAGQAQQTWSAPWIFRAGRQNVKFTYSAGYPPTSIAGELQTIPATPGPYLVTPNNTGPNYTDGGVKYFSSGNPLTPVTTAPAAGQYFFNPATGQYLFNSADQGAQILVSYTYGGVPFELTQYLMEWAQIRYLSAKRAGLKSTTSKAGESNSFDNSMPDHILAAIQRYRSQAPVNS